MRLNVLDETDEKVGDDSRLDDDVEVSAVHRGSRPSVRFGACAVLVVGGAELQEAVVVTRRSARWKRDVIVIERSR